MAAHLEPGESPREGLRRIVREQFAKALDELADGSEPAEVVHSVRKRLKRLRALLRLARGGMDEATFDREKGRLRDAARPLSEARDAAVLVATLDGLGLPGAVAKVRDTFLLRQSEATRRALGDGPAFDDHAATLRDIRDALEGAFADVTWPVLREGLRRIERQGRRAFRVARESSTDVNLHEWRKRVKDLGYALDALRPIRPSVIGQRANLADELAEALGDDHDLAVLRGALLAGTGPAAAAVELVPAIDARRESLRESAFGLGRKVYRERPSDSADRLDRAWRTWRSRASAR
jgi:CHAD domain-containing protein